MSEGSVNSPRLSAGLLTRTVLVFSDHLQRIAKRAGASTVLHRCCGIP
jgi:hypothetical protein